MLTPRAESAVRFRLRSKFIVAAALLVLIVAVLIVLIQQFNMRRTIIRQAATQGASITDTIEATAGYYVIFGLTDDLRKIVTDLKLDMPLLKEAGGGLMDSAKETIKGMEKK